MKLLPNVPRHSFAEYVQEFARHGQEFAYAQRHGYRMLRWTYREIGETAAQFARELEARGTGPRDPVLLWGENSAEWAAAFWGCVLRGAVIVPMDDICSREFARRVARQVEAKLIVCSRKHWPNGPAAPAIALEDLPRVVARHPRSRYASPALRRADMLQVIFTSGTTADPKGVVISHGNVLANLEPLETEIRKYLKYERFFHPIRFLSLVPLSHVFGQFMGLFVPPVLGGTTVFQNTLNPSEVLRVVKRERISVLVAVPRLLETLRDKLERDLEAEGRLGWLREQMRASANEKFLRRMWRFRRIHRRFGWKFWAIICGGAALPRDVEAFWDRLGFAVIQGYGLTETTSLVTLNHPFRLGKGSIGKVLSGREIKLDADGEILVRGESIATAYWQNGAPRPGASGTPEDASWFRTGDLGELDADGNLHFKGRKKNVIVTPEGMNVYPEDLEAALRREPEVRDCVIVGLARDANAEPCAVVILRDPALDLEPIIRRVNQSLAGYQQMRRWLAWPDQDFPRTSTGKPRTGVIAEAVAARLAPMQHQGAAPQTAANHGGLAEVIARATGRAPGRLPPDARLESDLNLSSIDRVELLSAIEERYQIDLNETKFTAATTVGELEGLLRERWVEATRTQRPADKYPLWAQRWPTTWIRRAVYYLLMWPATVLLGTPRIRGRDHLRGARGPLLVVCNHTLYLDPAFILLALPWRLRHRLAVAMGGERLRALCHPPAEMNFVLRCFCRVNYALVVALFNVFPLPQHSGFRESFQFAGESVDRGYSVLVFPEGELTPDGKMHTFRSGIGLLAHRLNVPIAPLRIDGLYELKQLQKRNARFGQVRVTIGSPIEFDTATNPEQIARELESRVAGL